MAHGTSAPGGMRQLVLDLFGGPERPLIDGRGQIWWPHATDPAALRAYTLGHQVTEPYDFTRAIATAAREFAPDLFIVTGPGTTMGGAVAQSLVLAGWKYAARSWSYTEVSINSPAGIPIYQFKSVIVAAGILLFIQGIAQVCRCILCMRDGYWTEAEEDVRETEDDLIRRATEAETARALRADRALRAQLLADGLGDWVPA